MSMRCIATADVEEVFPQKTEDSTAGMANMTITPREELGSVR